MIIALLTSFVSYAQFEEGFQLEYHKKAFYLYDSTDSKSRLYLSDSSYEQGIIGGSVIDYTNSQNEIMAAIFFVRKKDEKIDPKYVYQASTFFIPENQTRKEDHIEYFAKNHSWKIEMYKNIKQIRIYTDLIPSKKIWKKMTIYYLN